MKQLRGRYVVVTLIEFLDASSTPNARLDLYTPQPDSHYSPQPHALRLSSHPSPCRVPTDDVVLRDLHAGLVPRAWRSYLVPIWPRTARLALHVTVIA